MLLLLMPQLTFYERQRIESGLRVGHSHRDIARHLNRDHRVIDREVKRNSSLHLPYIAASAQRIFEARRRKTNIRKIEKPENADLRDYVVKQMKEKDCSPEQIAGRLKEHSPLKGNKSISYESIYDYIYNGAGRFGKLYAHLRTARSKRQRRFDRRKRPKNNIKDRISIHDRPEIINEKERFGDWETDSLCFSKQLTSISVQYERKAQLCRLNKIQNKTAEESEMAVWKSIESLPQELWQSITRDNGSENVDHEKTNEVFGVQSYFCDGYASWQKGGVENINKLIRQYLPRKSDLATLTDNDIYLIQEKLNNRPRKSLNYLTPNEVIAKHLEVGH